MNTQSFEKAHPKISHLLTNLINDYEADFGKWISLQESLSCCLEDTDKEKDPNISQEYREALASLVYLDSGFHEDLKKVGVVVIKIIGDEFEGNERKLLLELDNALAEMDDNHINYRKHWVQTLKNAQLHLDISEPVSNSINKDTKPSDIIFSSLKTHGSAITNALNLKPSLSNDIKTMRSELSLVIKNLGTI